MTTSLGVDPQTVLRMACGAWFIPHAVGKALHVDRASQTFSKAGFRPARLFVILTLVMELIAALGLLLDLYAAVAAALAVLVLAGAAYAVIRINGWNWRWQRQGPEYMIFWALACVLSVLR